jgi:hypothetical protein
MLAAANGAPLGLWDSSTGRELQELANQSQGPNALAFSADGRCLLSAGADEKIYLWELSAGQVRLALLREGSNRVEEITAAAFSPDCRQLALGTAEGVIRVWQVSTGKRLQEFSGQRGPVTALAFTANSATLASGSADTTVILWDLPTLPPEKKTTLTLSAQELEPLWQALAAPDAARAYQAVQRLGQGPEQSVPFLRERLRPLSQEQIDRWIRQLDDEKFEVRQQAAQELAMHPHLVAPSLRKALAGRPSAEVRRRIKDLLDTVPKDEYTMIPASLRGLRALEILERIGSPAAGQVVEMVARGSTTLEMTQQAHVTLQRMTSSVGKSPR